VKYPKWAPKKMCENLDELKKGFDGFSANSSTPQHRAILNIKEVDIPVLERLLTHTDMSSVWPRLEQLPHLDINGWFYQSVLDAYAGPSSVERLTKGERTALLRKIKKKVKELTQLVEQANILETKLLPIHSDDKSLYRYRYGQSLESIFDQLVTTAETKLTISPLLVKPHDERARQVYFIRFLSRSFRITFNKPRHRIVANTSRAVLQDDSIDENLVAKITNTFFAESKT